MAYKVRQTGNRVQDVLDDVENKLEVVTQSKNGYMSKEDKTKIDNMEEVEYLDNYDIDQIWNSTNI